MCGIAGHLGVGGGVTAVAGGGAQAGRAPGDAVSLVRAMTAALHHRGPDASGVHRLGPAVLGHARLAIIDLSPDANQPMLSADGQTAVVFNGEIYNFADLAAELRAAGVPLRTRSDTEVLLELYRLRGVAFVEKLRGMFAFAIWDAPRRRLVLGRDRLGIKPVYYARVGDDLLFASDLRALLRSPDVDRTVDEEALACYLAMRYVPGPRTLVRGV